MYCLNIIVICYQDQEEIDYLAGAQLESDSEEEGDSDNLNVTFTMSDLKVCLIKSIPYHIVFLDGSTIILCNSH